MIKKKLNLLISCASNKTHTIEYIQEVLNRLHTNVTIFTADKNNKSIIANFNYKFLKMPELLDINKKKILRLCDKNKIDVIIPTSDFELSFWGKHKVDFNNNKIFPMISEHKTISLCQDKWLFYKYLKKNKIKTPKSFVNLKKIINKNKKFVIKENNSNFLRKDNYVNINFTQLRKKISLFKKPIIQEYIPGIEISIDIFTKNKTITKKNIIMRRREVVKFGESEKTTIYRNNFFLKKIVELIKLFDFDGHVMFQAIIAKKKLFIIECNPRLGGASIASMYWGLDSLPQFIKSNLKINHKKQKLKNIIYN